MKTKLSKKRAISTVLTTVIILVSSVVLGSGVVLYGTSLFQTGQSAIIYFKLTNGTISSLDSGLSTNVSIYAGKADTPQSVTVAGKTP